MRSPQMMGWWGRDCSALANHHHGGPASMFETANSQGGLSQPTTKSDGERERERHREGERVSAGQPETRG